VKTRLETHIIDKAKDTHCGKVIEIEG